MRLYEAGKRAFSHNGIGVLSDAVSCLVTEERNGGFELEMQYPMDGIHYRELQNNRIILAKPNPLGEEQPFRIYKISKPLGGIVTVNAAHISYDLSGIILSPFSASSAPEVFGKLSQMATPKSPFIFWTDKSTAGDFSIAVPSSVRSVMGDSEGSILNLYGGEYSYDRFTVRLYNERGQDNGVTIRYGKNLTDLTQEENIQDMYTGVYPYWTNSDGDLVQLPEKIVNAPGQYSVTKISALDLSGEFEEMPSVEQLRERTQQYLKDNNIGVPSVSLTVSFIPLEQTEEYKNIAPLERVMLCDQVTVQFEKLGVDATAKVVKTVYDVLAERYDSIELGDAKANIADTIVGQQQAIENAPSKTFMQQAIESATGLITGNKGGYVVLHSSTGSKQPDEILIMDTPDIQTATKVWRWNKGGLGYSSSGYNGPYGTAITQDGQIVADFINTGTLNAALVNVTNLNASNINAGTLNANLIKAGILSSQNGASTINMETGECNMTGIYTSEFTYPDGSSGRVRLAPGMLYFWEEGNMVGGFQAYENGVACTAESYNIRDPNTEDIKHLGYVDEGKVKIIADELQVDTIRANPISASDIDAVSITSGSLSVALDLTVNGQEASWHTLTFEDGTEITYLGR